MPKKKNSPSQSEVQGSKVKSFQELKGLKAPKDEDSGNWKLPTVKPRKGLDGVSHGVSWDRARKGKYSVE